MNDIEYLGLLKLFSYNVSIGNRVKAISLQTYEKYINIVDVIQNAKIIDLAKCNLYVLNFIIRNTELPLFQSDKYQIVKGIDVYEKISDEIDRLMKSLLIVELIKNNKDIFDAKIEETEHDYYIELKLKNVKPAIELSELDEIIRDMYFIFGHYRMLKRHCDYIFKQRHRIVQCFSVYDEEAKDFEYKLSRFIWKQLSVFLEYLKLYTILLHDFIPDFKKKLLADYRRILGIFARGFYAYIYPYMTNYNLLGLIDFQPTIAHDIIRSMFDLHRKMTYYVDTETMQIAYAEVESIDIKPQLDALLSMIYETINVTYRYKLLLKAYRYYITERRKRPRSIDGNGTEVLSDYIDIITELIKKGKYETHCKLIKYDDNACLVYR